MSVVADAVLEVLEADTTRDSSAADQHRNVKCPECNTVQSATHDKCSKCGHSLAGARAAKMAKTQEAAHRFRSVKAKNLRAGHVVHHGGSAQRVVSAVAARGPLSGDKMRTVLDGPSGTVDFDPEERLSVASETVEAVVSDVLEANLRDAAASRARWAKWEQSHGMQLRYAHSLMDAGKPNVNEVRNIVAKARDEAPEGSHSHKQLGYAHQLLSAGGSDRNAIRGAIAASRVEPDKAGKMTPSDAAAAISRSTPVGSGDKASAERAGAAGKAAGAPKSKLAAAQGAAKPSMEERTAAAKAAHPAGSKVTTEVHSIGGRSESVTGEVVDHKRGQLVVKTSAHGNIMVPVDKATKAAPAAKPGGPVSGTVHRPLRQIANGKGDSLSKRRKQDLVNRGLAKWDGPGKVSLTDKGKSMIQEADAEMTTDVERAVAEAADSLAKASTPEPFSSSRTSNWVARGGGLPAYIQHIAHDLMEKRGKSESNAIQMAIGIVKRWARGGGNVDANTRAAASKAVAEWEALKAKSKVKEAAELAVLEAAWSEDDPAVLAEAARYEADAELRAELLEAKSDPDGDGDNDSGSGGDSDKDASGIKVFCPKGRHKVTPTKDGKCPVHGNSLDAAIKMHKRLKAKTQEAALPGGDAVQEALLAGLAEL